MARPRRRAWVLAVAGGLLLTANPGCGGEVPSLADHQVKALCLVNFAKYVEWPAGTFPQTNSPITIGILGEKKFGEFIKHAVRGKNIGSREVVVREMTNEDKHEGCHLLFVSASEKHRLSEVLGLVTNRPVLTVGEFEGFRKEGGVINFVKREGKVRFKVNLNAARAAQLHIRSQLLALADDVEGK